MNYSMPGFLVLHYLPVKAKILVTQSCPCPTLCDSMDYSPPGFSVHGIHQARYWSGSPFPISRGSSWPRDQIKVSCIAGRFFIVRATTISWSLLKVIKLSQWCYLTISSSEASFSFSFKFSQNQSLPKSQLFASGGQSIGASALASILPMNIQDWFPLGLTGLISLKFTGHSRVSSSITIWNHQFFSVQLSLWSNSNTCTLLLEKP